MSPIPGWRSTGSWSNGIFGRVVVAGKLKDGKPLDFTVRVTDGYKKTNGRWLIAHEHVSVLFDFLTGKADLTSKP